MADLEAKDEEEVTPVVTLVTTLVAGEHGALRQSQFAVYFQAYSPGNKHNQRILV